MLISEPETIKYAIREDLDFLVMACDGIWDVCENDEVCYEVYRVLDEGKWSHQAAN